MHFKRVMVLVICMLALILRFPLSFAQGGAEPAASGNTAASPAPERKLPLTLNIRSFKKSFSVGEKIAFELVLTNVSNDALRVYSLDNKALFCSINGVSWGSKDPSGDLSVILMSGESVRKKFKVSGVSNPGKFVVSCSYGMGLKDSHPTAKASFVVEK